ncbi:MAG: hypothetical protein OHK0038_12830 [Flammeovirgaceae bacterium]
MESILEIIFSLLGLFLYWFFTTKTEKQKKVTPPQGTLPPLPKPKNQKKQQEEIPKNTSTPNSEAQPTTTTYQPPITFGDLLKELTDPQRIAEIQKKVAEDKAKEEKKISENLENYSPENVTKKYTENTSKIKDSSVSAYDLNTKKKKSRIGKLLEDPQNIRDALIISEIINKRMF